MDMTLAEEKRIRSRGNFDLDEDGKGQQIQRWLAHVLRQIIST